MKQLMICATASGVGKTTFSLGLMRALVSKGYEVQPFKVGPDYIDTAYHSRICGRPSINLDEFLVPETQVLQGLYLRGLEGADIGVVEGVMGMFDGFGKSHLYCSSAGMAKKLNLPVLLLVDGKSSSTSVAAMVKGFVEFDPEIDFLGVVVNRVASQSHYQLIAEAIHTYCSIPVLGYLKKDPSIEIESRHLGLKQAHEMDLLEGMLDKVADQILNQIDLDDILEKSETKIQATYRDKLGAYACPNPSFKGLKLGLARDHAFSFYYQDNLRLLEDWGIELIPFSPLKEDKVPQAHGYYFGGGYPELFAQNLASNASMRASIKEAGERGIPIFAECGGLMYLGQALQVGEETYPMVGLIQGQSSMTKSLKRFGYCQFRAYEDCLLSSAGQEVRGHEFHHSEFHSSQKELGSLVKVRDGQVVKTWLGGYGGGKLFASYLHCHFYQEPQLALGLVLAMLAYKEERG